MLLRYRVATGSTGAATATVDLEVRCPADASVGEVADAVAAHLGLPGKLSLGPPGGRRPPRDRPAIRAAPRSGTTVALGPADAVTDGPALRSPATLECADGTRVRLAYGPDRVRLGTRKVEVVVGRDVVVGAPTDGTTLAVDGSPVLGTRAVRDGAVLTCGDDVAVLRVDGTLRPPAAGPFRDHTPDRAGTAADGDDDGTDPHGATGEARPGPATVRLPAPPAPQRRPGFPVLTATVPLVLGGALWILTGSAAVLAFVGFSVVFVVASGLETRREARSEERFRHATYRTELADALAELGRLGREEEATLDRHHPPVAGVATWPVGDGPDGRLWAAVATSVRLGVRVRPGSARPGRTDTGSGPGTRAIDAALVEVDRVTAPVTVRLPGTHIAFTGAGAEALARAAVLQACAHHGPDRLGLDLDVAADRRAAWRWATWLPHRDDDGAPPHRLVVLDGVGRGRAEARLRRARDGATTVVVVAADPADVPEGTGLVVRTDGSLPGRTAAAAVLGPDGAGFRPEPIDAERAERFARASAGLAPATDGGDGGPPPVVHLGAVLADASVLTDAERLARAWGAPPPGLLAPIGHDGAGVVAVDLRRDGPHAVVAGTTGAGKSELLRTVVLSTALHHPPTRVTFLLVDYKGGTAFADLERLPHTVGVVTDLTPELARRALVSLRAELRRREAAAAAPSGPTGGTEPALVVVVDEFATLAEELPAFVDGVVDLARRGRSLGIHLVLATQRPAGVVTDAIRANATLRVALRVADDDDGTDVVGTTEPARLPRTAPGRAVVRVGADAPFVLQSAHCGTPPPPRPAPSCRDLHRPADRPGPGPRAEVPVGVGSDRPSELELGVGTARVATDLLGLDPPRRPWLDPLPDAIGADELEPLLGAGPEPPGGVLRVGLVDRPEEQRRHGLDLDLGARGGVLVLGAPGAGRTGALRALAAAALAAGRQGHAGPDPWSVWCIDGGRDLADLGRGAGARAVVPVDDVERVLRLLRRLHRIAVSERGDGRRHLLVVDGIGGLVETQELVNRGEAMDLLARIAADGRAAGVHLAVSARRRAEVPTGVLAGLDHRIALRCATADDAEASGGPPTLADPDLPPGRGVLDGHWVQLVRVAPRTGPAVPGEVPPLPRTVERAALAAARAAAPAHAPGARPTEENGRSAPWVVPIGLRLDDLTPAEADLGAGHLLVVGPPRSGRTTALAAVLDGAHADAGPLHVVHVDGAADEPHLVLGRLAELADERSTGASRRALVAIDDVVDLLDGEAGAAADDLLLALLRDRRRPTLRVVATAEADALSRCYAAAATALRRGRRGLLLAPDPDLHPALLGTVLPRHDELPPGPGRAWAVDALRAGSSQRGGPVPLQVVMR